MILHVTAAVEVALIPVVLELGEDLLKGLAHHRVEHVDAPAVRHAEHHFLHARVGRVLDRGLHHRDQRGAALEAEPLVRGAVAHPDEGLEGLRLCDLVEDRDLVLPRELHPAAVLLELLAEPSTLAAIADVHVLDADRGAVRRLQVLDHLPQRRAGAQAADVRVRGPVEVRLLQPVMLQRKLRWTRPLAPEGIELARQVTFRAVRGNQGVHSTLERNIPTAARGTAAGERQVKALEERRQVRGNRAGISPEARVLRIQVLGAPAVHRRGHGSRVRHRLTVRVCGVLTGPHDTSCSTQQSERNPSPALNCAVCDGRRRRLSVIPQSGSSRPTPCQKGSPFLAKVWALLPILHGGADHTLP